LQKLSTVRELLPDTLLAAERLTRLVHIGELDRLADREFALIGLLLSDNHAKQRCLASSIGADHAYDSAARQPKIEPVDQQILAKRLLELFGNDHVVAEARSVRNRNLDLVVALLALLRQQLLVRGQPRLGFGLTRFGCHANPFEFARKRTLA